jgi:hypothetical protein
METEKSSQYVGKNNLPLQRVLAGNILCQNGPLYIIEVE